MKTYKIALLKGDGIGPEICESVKAIVNHLNLDIEFEEFNVGEAEYFRNGALIPEAAFDSIERNKIIIWNKLRKLLIFLEANPKWCYNKTSCIHYFVFFGYATDGGALFNEQCWFQ